MFIDNPKISQISPIETGIIKTVSNEDNKMSPPSDKKIALRLEVLKQLSRDSYGMNVPISPEVLDLISAQQEHIQAQEM